MRSEVWATTPGALSRIRRSDASVTTLRTVSCIVAAIRSFSASPNAPAVSRSATRAAIWSSISSVISGATSLISGGGAGSMGAVGDGGTGWIAIGGSCGSAAACSVSFASGSCAGVLRARGLSSPANHSSSTSKTGPAGAGVAGGWNCGSRKSSAISRCRERASARAWFSAALNHSSSTSKTGLPAALLVVDGARPGDRGSAAPVPCPSGPAGLRGDFAAGARPDNC